VAAYRSTVYRLDATGEVYEVMVEEADEELLLDWPPAVAMAAGCAEETFDGAAWWSKQLGGALERALVHH
jgi:hypothetical protein